MTAADVAWMDATTRSMTEESWQLLTENVQKPGFHQLVLDVYCIMKCGSEAMCGELMHE